MLHWMVKGRVPSTHHLTEATWNTWVVLITQGAQMENLNSQGILEEIMDWTESRDFGTLLKKTHTKEASLYKGLAEGERHGALFTNRSCHVIGNH